MTSMYEGTSLPARLLRTSEAGRFLGLSGRTLEKHRTFGTGPTYRKIGGRVVYALDDLRCWADRGAQLSTTDPGRGGGRVFHPLVFRRCGAAGGAQLSTRAPGGGGAPPARRGVDQHATAR